MTTRVRRSFLSLAGAVGVLAVVGVAQAATVTLNHIDRGAINSTFAVTNGAPSWKIVTGSYQLRHLRDSTGVRDGTHDYFTFDLSSVRGTITAAELRITHAANSFPTAVNFPTETVRFFDVSTPAATLAAIPDDGTQLPPNDTVFNDLGSGTPFGDLSATVASNGTVASVLLNPQARASLNATRGAWVVGGAVIVPSGQPGGTDAAVHRVFVGSGDVSPNAQLVLTVTNPAVPVFGKTWQLGTLLAGLCAVGLWGASRRRS
jgi:hypothetical protein